MSCRLFQIYFGLLSRGKKSARDVNTYEGCIFQQLVSYSITIFCSTLVDTLGHFDPESFFAWDLLASHSIKKFRSTLVETLGQFDPEAFLDRHTNFSRCKKFACNVKTCKEWIFSRIYSLQFEVIYRRSKFRLRKTVFGIEWIWNCSSIFSAARYAFLLILQRHAENFIERKTTKW